MDSFKTRESLPRTPKEGFPEISEILTLKNVWILAAPLWGPRRGDGQPLRKVRKRNRVSECFMFMDDNVVKTWTYVHSWAFQPCIHWWQLFLYFTYLFFCKLILSSLCRKFTIDEVYFLSYPLSIYTPQVHGRNFYGPLKKSDGICLVVRGFCGREVVRCCKKRCQRNNQEWRPDEGHHHHHHVVAAWKRREEAALVH